MGAGVPPGLQNRCAGRSPVGGFDSRPPPLSLRRTAGPDAISPAHAAARLPGRVRFPSASALGFDLVICIGKGRAFNPRAWMACAPC
jgi:hypothetical protein